MADSSEVYASRITKTSRWPKRPAIRPQDLRIIAEKAAKAAASDSDSDGLDPELVTRTLGNYDGGDALDLIGNASKKHACSVCLESIGRTAKIWSCPSCCQSLHLNCIQSWASRLISFQREKNLKVSWYCPNCRNEFEMSAYPTEYLCYCGQQVDPEVDLWSLPHSCGQICEKKLVCGHVCSLLCHPGKCPSCPRTVEMECFGAHKKQMQRCSASKSFCCGDPCGKRRPCGHECTMTCHDDCGPCPVKIVAKCRCGLKKALVPCSEAHNFSCGRVCGKMKPCGKHRCEQECHAGACTECETIVTCACGHTTAESSCAKPTRVRCYRTCNKPLACGRHKCTRVCHVGDCGPCDSMRRQQCRCGQLVKDLQCQKDFLCDRRCTRMRGCNYHKCSRRCCDGKCPPCSEPCGRKLDCGLCKCTLVCGHAGTDLLGHALNCPPCPKTVVKSCHCGATKASMPCGSTDAPPCTARCPLPSLCRHAKQLHECHAGVCPPCRETCREVLFCGHQCREQCHDPLLPAVQNWIRKSDLRKRILNGTFPERKETPCPPCRVKVKRRCMGAHEERNMHCSDAAEFECGQPCGSYLSCGNHVCPRTCHVTNRREKEDFDCLLDDEVSTAAEDLEEDSARTHAKSDAASGAHNDTTPSHSSTVPPVTCGDCDLVCMRARPDGCRHKCPWSCHFEPCPPCYEDKRVSCYCGQTNFTFACAEVLAWGDVHPNPWLICLNKCHRKLACGHLCVDRCHPGACAKPCMKNRHISCSCGHQQVSWPCREDCPVPNRKLQCTKECPPKPPEPVLAQVPSKENLESNSTKVRERRKPNKRQYEEEAKQRKQIETTLAKKRYRERLLRKAGIAVITLAIVALACYFIYQEVYVPLPSRPKRRALQ
eukprot:GEMP01006601.1.p1 GENE.GEMP01006601.1~~GEMP01006601.1.p1  ORF type:complete len:882 (+),score=184.98 GEMP01006601.1:86-2731(+)